MNPNDNPLPIVALSTGDPAGIGPEISIKAALDEDVRRRCRPVLFGDPSVVEAQNHSCGINAKIEIAENVAALSGDDDAVALVALKQFNGTACRIGAENAENGRASVDCGRATIRAAMAGEVASVVAAPNTKSSINMAGIDYDGYLSLVSEETELPQEDIFMMLVLGDTSIAHCTLHSSVRRSLELITEARVRRVIEAVDETLKAIGHERPRILVSGVNPHASENGLFGDEEREIIAPAISATQAAGITAEGPVPADLMLHRDDFDAFIVMLHDQGHIPAKLMSKHGTAGVIIGGNVLISSVAHGSALDIAGQGIADPAAMVEAIRWITGAGNA